MGWNDTTRPHRTAGTGESGFTVFAGRLLHLEPVPDRFVTLLHGYFQERFCVFIDRPCFFFLLNQGRVQEGHPCTVKFTYIKPFLDDYGFWFISHRASVHYHLIVGYPLTGYIFHCLSFKNHDCYPCLVTLSVTKTESLEKRYFYADKGDFFKEII